VDKKEAVVHGETHYCLEEEERFILATNTMEYVQQMFEKILKALKNYGRNKKR
jgi:hypothetical protein